MMKPTAAGVFWITYFMLCIVVGITIWTLKTRVEHDAGAHAAEVGKRGKR